MAEDNRGADASRTAAVPAKLESDRRAEVDTERGNHPLPGCVEHDSGACAQAAIGVSYHPWSKCDLCARRTRSSGRLYRAVIPAGPSYARRVEELVTGHGTRQPQAIGCGEGGR